MAVFFWTLSLIAPISILIAAELEQLKFFKQYLPVMITPFIFAVMVFFIFLIFGCISGAFGIERKKKKEVEKEIELRPTPIEQDEEELFLQ